MTRERPGQVLIGFWADERLVAEIDAARHGLSRSHFARTAMVEYLRANGADIPDDLGFAPDRVRGRPPKTKGPDNPPKNSPGAGLGGG